MTGLGNARNMRTALKALAIDAGDAVAPRPAAMTGREIGDVGIHLDGSDFDEGKIAYAEMIATTFGARVEGFLANTISTAPLPAGPGSGWLEAEFWKNGRDAGDEIERRLSQRLSLVDADTELRRFDGLTFELLSAMARRARILDLMILGRPYGDPRQWPEFVEAVLFEAGATALVVPPEMKKAVDPQTILVAWKDTIEASHAVAASLPFLKRAANVVLVTVAEDAPDEERHREPAGEVAAHLARHGVTVEVRSLPKWDIASDAILNEAGIIGADLIVVGAYGRSRIREWILGGVTRHLLTRSSVPLLLSH